MKRRKHKHKPSRSPKRRVSQGKVNIAHFTVISESGRVRTILGYPIYEIQEMVELIRK